MFGKGMGNDHTEVYKNTPGRQPFFLACTSMAASDYGPTVAVIYIYNFT